MKVNESGKVTRIKKSFLSLGWLDCQSIAQMSKSRKTANPGVLLYSCNLPTFIHFHLLSFKFIHLHSLSFTSNFHPFMHAFMKNVNSQKTFIHIFLARHTYCFFSQLKRGTLIHQMKLKFQCHTYKRLMEKIKNKPDRATMRPGCVSACIDHVT